MAYKTEQEEFWATGFGDDYIKRNKINILLPKKINLFSQILKRTFNAKSFLEFGANIGANLLAINYLKPQAELNAIDINKKACQQLKNLKICNKIWEESILKKRNFKKVDLTFTVGVLIHINPFHLARAYENLYNNSKKYILVCEYYNPQPVTVNYRGHKERLYKRDFAGDLLSQYSNLRLIDYKFCYKNDNNFPLDDITWFLLEKSNKK